LRDGKASIKEAYARVRRGEIFLEGMNITPYEQGNRYNHDPVRTRKLLLHRKEIQRLIGAVEQQGLTLIPLELYFKNGRAKVAIALGRGKKQHDKRQDLKRRVAEREAARAVSIRGRR
jgi:SsrA-binding protein